MSDAALLSSLSAQELSAAYRDRKLSPVEVTQDVIAQVERWEPHLQATWLFRPEAALEQARASEARWLRGDARGPLDGVPATIKENIATRGDPMPAGTAAVDLKPATADAPPAARLKEAGAVIVSKTTMPDYGMLSSGLSSFHTLARNPWDLRLTPGGSSAGAGAAAAAGYGPLHLGTDIGGSLRLPASWCGVFTLKPSLGRVPIDPPYMGRAAGPMTRTVGDAALLMQALSKPDARDSMGLPPQDIAWASFDVAPDHLRGLRFGLLLDAGCGLAVEPEIQAAVEQAARLLEKAGAVIEPMQPFMSQAMLDGMDHFWRMRSLVDMKSLRALRLRDLACVAQHAGRGRGALAHQRPAAAAGAHRLHRALQHVGAAGRLGELRVLGFGPADRAADRRPALRRSRRAARGTRLRADPRTAAALAPAARPLAEHLRSPHSARACG
ncbi:amidase [Variovorax atrisoli]|uniref:amidase n=1 Tax=Variovorax atrisoli TaxID=3394203 RepID=UPI0034782CD2